MKAKIARNLAWLLVLGLAGMAAPAMAADNPFIIKYPFKTAIVKYRLAGNETGSRVLYIKGNTTAQHTDSTASMFGMKQTNKRLVITQPKRVTMVDLAKGKAQYTGNIMTYMAEEYEKLSPAEKARVRQNAEKMGKEFSAAIMGGKVQTSQGSFLGKPVVITQVGGLTSYTWKDHYLVLKTKGSIMGIKTDMEATSVQTGVPVPSKALEVPSGIKAVYNQQADQQQRQMARNMINNLKDPEFGKKGGRGMSTPPGGRTPQQGQPDQQEGSSIPSSVKDLKKLFKF